jgi:hypothetical protein
VKQKERMDATNYKTYRKREEEVAMIMPFLDLLCHLRLFQDPRSLQRKQIEASNRPQRDRAREREGNRQADRTQTEREREKQKIIMNAW